MTNIIRRIKYLQELSCEKKENWRNLSCGKKEKALYCSFEKNDSGVTL
jgi:hypothetical protein